MALHAFLFCFLFFTFSFLQLNASTVSPVQLSLVHFSSVQFGPARPGSARLLDSIIPAVERNQRTAESHPTSPPGQDSRLQPRHSQRSQLSFFFFRGGTPRPSPPPSHPPVQLNSVKSKRKKKRFKDLSCLFFCI